jgi:hypothetical protein
MPSSRFILAPIEQVALAAIREERPEVARHLLAEARAGVRHSGDHGEALLRMPFTYSWVREHGGD